MAEKNQDFQRRQTSSLSINIEQYLKNEGLEKQKIEFKKSWNKGPTLFQVVHTISAFANDYFNDNGGYIVIGVEENDSGQEASTQAKLPPIGIKSPDLDKIQKEIIGACKGRIDPPYTPRISPEKVMGENVLVIHVTPSETRPHKAQESAKGCFSYYIRKGSQTVEARKDEIDNLLRNATNVPFDDRRAVNSKTGESIHLQQIDTKLVLKYLDTIQSKINPKLKPTKLMERLELLIKCGDEETPSGKLKTKFEPRNVALLMFNNHPHKYFHGAKIEIALFSRDNDLLEEKIIEGPLDKQIKEAIDFIVNTTNKEVSVDAMNYPQRALRESIVNAVYHRGYEQEHNSPTKIYIRPECLEICSYPGPHHTLEKKHFTSKGEIPLSPARNRRIGEFLKELKLAEARCTGVSTIFKSMKKNSNPEPQFDFDNYRFQVKLPAHPKFQVSILLKEIGDCETTGNIVDAIEIITDAFDKDPTLLTSRLKMKLLSLVGYDLGHPILNKYPITENEKEKSTCLREVNNWLKSRNKTEKIPTGIHWIERASKAGAEACDLEGVTELAIRLSREMDPDSRKLIFESSQKAHQLLAAFGNGILSSNSIIAYNFGLIKYNIYTLNKEKKERRASLEKNSPKLIQEAEKYIRQAIVDSEKPPIDTKKLAEQYVQLGYVMFALFNEKKATQAECEECYEKAEKLDPKVRINSFLRPERQTYKKNPPPKKDANNRPRDGDKQAKKKANCVKDDEIVDDLQRSLTISCKNGGSDSERDSLLNHLNKLLQSKDSRKIDKAVFIIKELRRYDVDVGHLQDVTKFVVNKVVANNFQSNKDAQKLLEAYGDNIIEKNGLISYYLAVVKYNIYVLNEEIQLPWEAKHNFFSSLEEARHYANHAIAITDNPELLAVQFKHLGLILSVMNRLGKIKKSEILEYNKKAKMYRISLELKEQPRLDPVTAVSNELNTWLLSCANVTMDVSKGVEIIRRLVKLNGTLGTLENRQKLLELVSNLVAEARPAMILKSNKNAEKLLEACGERNIWSSGELSLLSGTCKYNIYMAKKASGIDLVELLVQARQRCLRAYQMSSSRSTLNYHLLSMQCHQLGKISHGLSNHRREMGTENWFEKARYYERQLRTTNEKGSSRKTKAK